MTGFLQGIIDLVVVTLNALFFLFPDSPFSMVLNSQFNNYVSQINYFIPIYEFVAIGEAWLVAVTVWYCYVVIARWLKAVE